MSTVKRVYVEKKPDYAVKAKELHDEIKNYLNIDAESISIGITLYFATIFSGTR